MNPFSIQVANGVAKATSMMIRPQRVSRSPRSRYIMKKGRMITTAGMNWVASSRKNRLRFSTKSNRENA